MPTSKADAKMAFILAVRKESESDYFTVVHIGEVSLVRCCGHSEAEAVAHPALYGDLLFIEFIGTFV